MTNKSKCPGCKKDFTKGRSFSVHLTSCKSIASAADTALRKHKANSAKKLEVAKSAIAKRRELAAEANQNAEPSVDPFPDPQEMVVDTNVGSPQRSPSPPPRPSGRPGRRIRLPRRYRDELPPNPNPIIITNPEPDEEPEARASPELIEIPESSVFCTEKNSFGVYRKYALGPPTITPDEAFTLSSVSDSISIARDPADSPSNVETPPSNYFAPFLNASTFLLTSWFYNSKGTISFNEADKLVQEVIRHEDFNSADFGPTFSISRELKRIDKDQISTSPESSDPLPFGPEDGWIESSISIPVPCDGFKCRESDAPRFEVKGIWHRRPLEVLKKAYSEPAADKFHTTPFKEYWKPSEDEPEERIYSETFTADVFNDEYECLRATPREGPNTHLEPFIAGMMFYSDATHLANFGTASLYPMYLYIGNQSQYSRAKPSEFTAHHIAYIPKVFKKNYGVFFV